MDAPKTRLVLYWLAAVGFYGTWIRSFINGTLAVILSSSLQTLTLPGSSAPLKTSLTGLYYPVDILLDVLIAFFWPAVDGSSPSTSAFALYFASQHLAIVATTYIDAGRKSYPSRWTSSATFWLLMFQMTAIGASGPFYALLNLAELPQAAATDVVSVSTVASLPFSLGLGYVVPTILMGLRSPSVVSSSFQQVAVATWNVFPLWMQAIHSLIPRILPRLGVTTSSNQMFTEPASRSTIRSLYASVLAMCFAGHVAFLTTIGLASLFPMILKPDYSILFEWRSLVLLPTSWAQASSPGEGILDFMKWDLLVGSGTIFIVAVYKLNQARAAVRRGPVPMSSIVLAILASAVLGPGAIVVAIYWKREELLLSRREDGKDDRQVVK